MGKIKINDKIIGGRETFIIAEIGSNHNQSLQLAYESIDAAKECGADAVKFQSIDLNSLYFRPSEETIALHRKIDLEEDWHKLLKDYCDKRHILFFSSPTYIKSIDILEEIGVSLYKLASAQIGTFPQIIREVARRKKPVILSTGLVSYADLEKVINIFQEENNNQYIILHCNSIYPTPYDKVNLKLMNVYREMFQCPVGFSDHTDDIFIPIAAVALGAKVIEKHFAIDRNLPVPDAQYSLEPNDFKRMVDGIRAAERAVGSDIRTDIQPEEKGFKERILTRLILKETRQQGGLLAFDDFVFKRHPSGVDCRELDLLLSKQAKFAIDVEANTLLEWSMIKY
jgi:sialic acid synthase SpsE